MIFKICLLVMLSRIEDSRGGVFIKFFNHEIHEPEDSVMCPRLLEKLVNIYHFYLY